MSVKTGIKFILKNLHEEKRAIYSEDPGPVIDAIVENWDELSRSLLALSQDD